MVVEVWCKSFPCVFGELCEVAVAWIGNCMIFYGKLHLEYIVLDDNQHEYA